MDLNVIILAAGQGKRMKSSLPKVLHEIKGIPMIVKILNEVEKINPKKIILVVSDNYLQIYNELKKYSISEKITFVKQEIPLGTGDAIKATLSKLDNDGNSLILNGDCPMIKYETILNIYNNFINNNYLLQITCIELNNPFGNGRIIKHNNEFLKIVEQKDCNPDENNVKLCNCGIYLVSNHIIKKYIPKINNNNSQKEYYLTDIVELFRNGENKVVGLFELSSDKEIEIYNVNTKEQLDYLNNL